MLLAAYLTSEEHQEDVIKSKNLKEAVVMFFMGEVVSEQKKKRWKICFYVLEDLL